MRRTLWRGEGCYSRVTAFCKQQDISGFEALGSKDKSVEPDACVPEGLSPKVYLEVGRCQCNKIRYTTTLCFY